MPNKLLFATNLIAKLNVEVLSMKTWTIYKHTLTADCEHCGWSYIGQTCKANLNERWKNGAGYTTKHGLVFSRAITKYTWDAFSHEILETGIPTQELANEREKYWISYYHTYIGDPECRGYNMTPGGEQWGNASFHWYTDDEIEICLPSCDACPKGFKPGRLPLTDAQKSKLKGRALSEETKQKISESKKGKIMITNGIEDLRIDPKDLESYLNCGYCRGKSKGLLFGYTHSEATIQKMKESSPHRKLSQEEKDHLREVNLGKTLTDEAKLRISESQKGLRWYTNGKVSVKAAEQPEGFWPGTLYRVSEETRQKLSEAAKGKVVSDETRKKLSASLKGKNLGLLPPNTQAIYCVETGACFKSISEAVRITKFSYDNIKKSLDTGSCCRHHKSEKSGLHFKYCEKAL